MKILLVDTVGTATAGITTYVHATMKILNDCGCSVKVFSKKKNETRLEFRLRFHNWIKIRQDYFDIIEAPDSGGCTAGLNLKTPIHIRLHCLYNIGRFYECLPIDNEILKYEQQAIQSAWRINSPSLNAIIETQKYVNFNCNNIYPNPLPIQNNNKRYLLNKDIDVLFLGRMQKLKGIDFLPDIIEGLPETWNIVFAGKNANKFVKQNKIKRRFEFIEDINGSKKMKIYARSKVVIIPSLFETYSMVAVEAMQNNCNVVAWSNLGFCEWFPKNILFLSPPWNIGDFVENIIKAHSKNIPIDYYTQYLNLIQNKAVSGIKNTFFR